MAAASDYQEASLEALDGALLHTAAYESWRAMDPGPAAAVDERYAALPHTDKAFIRSAFPYGLVPREKDLDQGLLRGDVELVATSGTTEERVINVWNQRWWDFSERESWKLHAVTARVCTGAHREAILTSARNVGPASDGRELPFQERRLGRLLYLNERSSPLLWTNETLIRIARELDEYRPHVLECNPSYLARFALGAERLGLAVAQPDIILFTYEFPSLLHLRQIKRVFGAPLGSSYGSTEAGYVFMECEHGAHHLNATSCRADFVPLPGAEEGIGSLRVTPFGNEWTALLRFDPGDLVRISTEFACPCGRNGAVVLKALEGRKTALTRTLEGRPVTQAELDGVLAAEEALVTYQLVQEGKGIYVLKAVLPERGRRGAMDRLHDALRELYGRHAVARIDTCSDLEPEASGKFLMAKGPPWTPSAHGGPSA